MRGRSRAASLLERFLLPELGDEIGGRLVRRMLVVVDGELVATPARHVAEISGKKAVEKMLVGDVQRRVRA